MKYIGKVERIEVTEKKERKHLEWIKLIIWYIGVIISFMPIFIEGLIYLSSNASIDRAFAMRICTKGDVLWILATLLVLTLVECYAGAIQLVGFKKWISLLGIILWGVCCAIWIVFKYIYSEGFDGNIVFWICSIMASIVLVICSALQLGNAEVEK